MGKRQYQRPPVGGWQWQFWGGAIALVSLSGCTSAQWPWLAQPAPEATPIAAAPAPTPLPPSPTPVVIPADVLERAAIKAASATTLAKTAVTQDDWNLVLLQWQKAIALLQPIPRSHPAWKAAQAPLAQYKKSLNQAQQAAKARVSPPVASTDGGSINPNTIGIVGGSMAAPETTVASAIAQLAQQQITFWQQQQRFAKTLAELGNTAPELTNYTLNMTLSGDKRVLLTAIAKADGLPSYTGTVLALVANTAPSPSPPASEKAAVTPATRLLSVVCASAKPAKVAPGLPTVGSNQQLQCPTGSVVAIPATSTTPAVPPPSPKG